MSWTQPRSVAAVLAEQHYLGSTKRGMAWQDDFGIIVVARPTARHVPSTWLELTRWCITSKEKNAGSQQWGAFIRALRSAQDASTVVSYSDPSAGHTGALYRACNWWWAPTWHRLRPPPTGNGSWQLGKRESVKDRWIFPVQRDEARIGALTITDGGVLKRCPWAVYREPGGVPYRNAGDLAGKN